MIGPCLVLLLGGAVPGAPAGPALDPAEMRIFHAVVVPAEAPDGAGPVEDPELPGAEAVPEVRPTPDLGEVILRKAAVLPTPEPSKER